MTAKSKKSTYEQIWSGEWFDYAGAFDLACCECHLVHELAIRKRDGKIQMRLTALPRSTAQLRRNHDTSKPRTARRRRKRESA
ncbi:hypothetical protein [Caudoviricetes sp.]|nr:hypothetical protein [Caudoviricetes sp.]